MQRIFLIIGLLFSPFLFAQEGELTGESITIKTAIGTELDAYVAGPENADRAILLLHDRWGFNHDMRLRAERFAERGFRALAIDVFDNRASDKMWLATEIMNSTDPEWIKTDVLAGIKYLEAPGRKVVTIGWGLGGWQAIQGALMAKDRVAAAISVYGDMGLDIDKARSLRSPVMGIFATKDEIVTQRDVAVFEDALKRSLVDFRIYSLEGDHGFADRLYPSYSPDLEEDTWDLVDRFIGTFVSG